MISNDCKLVGKFSAGKLGAFFSDKKANKRFKKFVFPEVVFFWKEYGEIGTVVKTWNDVKVFFQGYACKRNNRVKSWRRFYFFLFIRRVFYFFFVSVFFGERNSMSKGIQGYWKDQQYQNKKI